MKGILTPEKIDNTYNVSIRKTDLIRKTNTNITEIPFNSQTSTKKREIYQNKFHQLQYQDQQKESIIHSPQNQGIHKTYPNINNITNGASQRQRQPHHDIQISKKSNECIKQPDKYRSDDSDKIPLIEYQTQELGNTIWEENHHILKQNRHRQQSIFTKCSRAYTNSYTSEQIIEDNSYIGRKNINRSNIKKDILYLGDNSSNDTTEAQNYILNSNSKSKRKDAHVKRKDAHVESQPHYTDSLLTDPLAHSAVRNTYILPEYNTRTIEDNLTNNIKNIDCIDNIVDHNTMDRTDYEELNPIKKPKKHNPTNTDSMQKEWSDLEILQSQQKIILKRLQQTKIDMAIKSKRNIPYQNTPLHTASFATKGDNPIFYCIACNYKTESKRYFDNHHKSKYHHELLTAWKVKQEHKIDNTNRIEIENHTNRPLYTTKYYISSINKRFPNIKNKINKEIPQNTTKISQNKETTISEDQFPKDEYDSLEYDITYQHNKINIQDRIIKTISSHQDIDTQNNSNKEKVCYNTSEDLPPMEIVETPISPDTINDDIQSQTKQDENHKIIIKSKKESTHMKDNLDALTEIQNRELSNSNTYEIAIRKIHRKIPIQYRHNLIALLSTIYQSGTDYHIHINIRDKFQDIGHWILSKYHKLLKNRNTRRHLLNKMENKEYNLVSKTLDQEEEIKLIAGSARVIYDILIHCPFVPVEYLCLLATLLNKKEDHQYGYSSLVIPGVYSNYGEIIDLMLNVGAFYISTKEIIEETTITIDKENSRIEEKLPQTYNNHCHQSHENQNHISSTQKTIITDNLRDLDIRQKQLHKDDLLMQVSLQKSFDTLQNIEDSERQKVIQTINEDTNTSHQKTKNQKSSHQISEEQQDPYYQNSPLPRELQSEPDNTVYIEGIQGSEMEEVKQIFELNGPIKNMTRLTASTAIVTFYDPQTANAAISNLNGIQHNNIIITVVSCPSQFKEGDDNDTIYVKGVAQSNTGEIKEIFSLNGTVRKVIKLTKNTAIIKFHEQKSAKAAILNFNSIIYKNTNLTVLPARRKNKHTITEDENDSKININEYNIENDNKDHKEGYNYMIEAEIKQELFDIENTFSNESCENPEQTTSLYSQPSIPNSTISWPTAGMIYHDKEDKSYHNLQQTENLYSLKNLKPSQSNTLTNKQPEEQYSPSGTSNSYHTDNELLPQSPTPSSPFHGFESITSCSPDPMPKIPFDQRLNEYKDNAWELMVMEHIEIPPGMLSHLPIKITAENNHNIRPLKSQNIFVIIAALYPYPQINDGIYNTKNKLDQVVIKNSSKDILIFKKGEILEGVKAHTHNFVVQALLNNYSHECSIHMNKLENWTKWHHEAKIFQKILAYKKGFETLQEKEL